MRTSAPTRRLWRVLLPLVVAVSAVGSGTMPAQAAATEIALITVSEGQTVSSSVTENLFGQSVTATTTTSVRRDLAAEAEEAAINASAAAAIKCWVKPYTLVLKAAWSQRVLYRWGHTVRWCFKGNNTHRLVSDVSNNMGTGLGWEYVGSHMVDTNRTATFFYRERQAHYRLCVTPVVGPCPDHGYPTHGARYLKGSIRTYVARRA